jgi:DNA/RNA-binding domain of Phe-tRNA-synthetase-like protein
MGAGPSPNPREGFVDPVIRDEFPGLRLRWVTIPGRAEPSPRELVRRLRDLSNRYRGGGVVSMRTKPVPQAYRAFFRHIGLDPDVHRIPAEAVAVARLIQGGFRSVDHIADACLVALIETGVPVWALDSERVDDAGLGIRVAGAPAAGSLVVGDGGRVCARLFEDPLAEHAVGPRTRRVTLFAVAVDGVPEIHVEEALWCAADVLAHDRPPAPGVSGRE